jgi:hypothetical protein
MAVAGDRTKYAAGDLLVIDPTASRRLALAQQPYSTLVAGTTPRSQVCSVLRAKSTNLHRRTRFLLP